MLNRKKREEKFIKYLIIGLLLFLSGCNAQFPIITKTQTIPNSEIIKMNTVTIQAIHFEKAFFHSGEPAKWSVIITSDSSKEMTIRLVSRISHLDRIITEIAQDIDLNRVEQQVEFTWQPPLDTPMGYGLDVYLETLNGQLISTIKSVGFDVLEMWTQMPRYGFLTDFQPGRTDIARPISIMTDHHINALQFYDWMYRHEQFLTTEEPYVDLLGRQLSRQVIDELIKAAHARNIDAMPYTAIYGASIDFYRQHPDWALYLAKGKPALFGNNFMAIMDPRVDGPWMRHLLNQFEEILTQTQFDGIHLDQYGDPKVGYDINGNFIDLAVELPKSIDATKAVVDKFKPGGAVVFNCVTNWPTEQVANSSEDIIYIEVWPPYTSFTDLHALIVSAQNIGHGKPVVLAAYVHPQGSANPQINDAIIFASGGGHIELGEGNNYLADPYFPKYESLSTSQAETIKRYYDFAVRYQNWMGPQTQDATGKWMNEISIPGFETSNSLSYNKIYPLIRETKGVTAISLVNLLGLPGGDWNQPVPNPEPQSEFELMLEIGNQKVSSIGFTSPDNENFAISSLEFTQENGQLHFKVPGLNIWDLIIVQWE
jgi:dextranase